MFNDDDDDDDNFEQTCLRKSGPNLSESSKHFSNSPRKKLKEKVEERNQQLHQ